MYQMLAYATRLDCHQTLLLYPRWSGAPENPVEFETLEHPNRLVAATIDLHQPLNRPDKLIQEMKEILKEVPRYGTIT